MTNADRIRSMNDEELADAMIMLDVRSGKEIPFCINHKKCTDMLDADEAIPDEMCRQCLIDWLQKEEKREKENEVN